MKPQTNWAPAIVFVCLALPFGIVLGALTPPMQVPDEGHHFFRAFQVAEGGIVPKKVEGSHEPNKLPSYTGGDLPVGVVRFYLRYEPLILIPKIYIKKPWDNLREAAQYQVDLDQREFRQFSNTATYSPLPYLPQAVGIDVARLFTNSVQTCFYAARFANLLVSVLLIFLAIRITPVLAWMFAFLALTPMALFELASVSSDVMIFSICFLFIAWVLRCAYGPEECLTRAQWVGLFGLAAALGLIKQVYTPFVLLYFLIPVSKVGSRKNYWLMLGGLCATIVFAVGAWGLVASSTYSPVRAYADPAAQLGFILHHPDRFTWVVLRNLLQPSLFLFHLHQYIGYIGHLDAPMPVWFILVHALVLVLVALSEAPPLGEKVGVKAKLLCLVVWLIVGVLISTIGYMSWMPVGDEKVVIQGRYFIPTGPLLFLCLVGVWPTLSRAVAGKSRVLPVICASLYIVLSLWLTTWVLYERYYVAKK